MTQPPGFQDAERSNYVYKLNKSLHGLKQFPGAWYEKLVDLLVSLDFIPSPADSSLFVQKLGSKMTYVLVYVDDIIITDNDSNQCSSLITHFGTYFPVKDLGDLHFFLGLEVHISVKGLFLSQTKYAVDLLNKTNLLGIKPYATPSHEIFKLSTSDGEPLADPTEYRSVVGSLQYLTWTRPEITYAVNQICQHMQSPTTTHLTTAKRVFRYIKGTLGYGLLFTKVFTALQGYTDADCDGNPDNIRFTSGHYVFFWLQSCFSVFKETTNNLKKLHRG